MRTVFLPDYGTHCKDDEMFLFLNQRHKAPESTFAIKAPLIVCNDKTASRHNNGLSKAEIIRLYNSARFMEHTGHPLFWAVLGDGLLDMAPAEARAAIDCFLGMLVKSQGRAGYPPYWVTVFETKGGLHANIIFVGGERLARRLCRSFSRFMKAGYGEGKALQVVTDLERVVTRYLSKERTTQANFALGWSVRTRAKGSHRLPGGGDRVRLSVALRSDAVAAGAVKPWKVTRAKRKARIV